MAVIAGMTTIYSFALDRQCVLDLMARVDAIVLWFDKPFVNRRKEFKRLVAEHGKHLQRVRYIESKVPWHAKKFREPQLRALDDIRPDYVLQPDTDETFGPGFPEDFLAFQASGLDMMMFDYEMPTADGAIVEKQPRARHCKVFRWLPGLTFHPYCGYARPTGLTAVFAASSCIQHYCCYTPEIQQEMLKKYRSDDRRAFFGKRTLP